MSGSGRVCAILLASGFSKRFGEKNKLLAPFRGKALARHTLDLVCGLGCFRRIFFVAAGDAVCDLARGLPLTPVRNEHPERGQAESIRLGLEAASGDGEISRGSDTVPVRDEAPGGAADYYMFFPCDQPLLDGETVRRILEARRPGAIVRPHCQGEPGNPVLFSAAFREELLNLAKGEHGRDIISRHPESLIPVEIPPSPPGLSPLMDMDDPETLANTETVLGTYFAAQALWDAGGKVAAHGSGPVKFLFTFETVSAALEGECVCRALNIPCRLIPVPRALSSSCTYALTGETENFPSLARALRQGGADYAKSFRCVTPPGQGETWEESEQRTVNREQ
jgi:molybdenum cofactor cytidylyltransferase